MDNTKYGKYVVRKSVTKPEPWPTMEWIGETDYNTNVTFMITRVMEPCEMEEYPHSHDFDMYLHFVSYDYEHMDELFAEIEIGLGEEREMHTHQLRAMRTMPRTSRCHSNTMSEQATQSNRLNP